MFVITKQGMKLNSRLNQFGIGFDTYEQARQALRKYLRKNKDTLIAKGAKLGFGNKTAYGPSPDWDKISRNPVGYTNAGFTIRQVA